MSAMSLAQTVLRNLFSKPATRPYPQVARVYPARTRGQIGIDIDACIFCGICSKKCPTGAITVNRAEKSWDIQPFGCIQCGCCVEFCPKKCLAMMQDYTQPSAVKTVSHHAQMPTETAAVTPDAVQ